MLPTTKTRRTLRALGCSNPPSVDPVLATFADVFRVETRDDLFPVLRSAWSPYKMAQVFEAIDRIRAERARSEYDDDDFLRACIRAVG